MPQAPNSYETLVHVLVEQGKLDEAERTTDDALRKFPGHPRLTWWKHMRPLFRGRYDEWERTLDSLRFVQDVAQRNEARNAKIQLLRMQGRFRERERLLAERRAERMVQNSPVNAVNAARDSLWDIIDSKRPDTAAAVARFAKLFFEQKRNFRGPSSWDAALAFRFAGRADLTRAVLDSFTRYADSLGQARQAHPMFAHKIRAEIAAAEGRYRDAIAEVKLGDLLPDGRWHACEFCYFRDLSEAFDRAGESDSAIVWYEKAVNTTSTFTVDAQFPLMPTYLRRLGELYEQKGDRRRAAERYVRFVEIRKNADPEFQPEVAEIRSRIARLRS
jgi:tetratricopeptide (TPR) repeat protein